MDYTKVKNILDDYNVKTKQAEIHKLEMLIGTDENVTDLILEKLIGGETSQNLLEISSLLIMERPNEIVPFIRKVLQDFPDVAEKFINELLSSAFYAQRQVVPSIILNLDIPNTKKILNQCFNDPITSVVQKAVLSISMYLNSPYTDEELLELAMFLNTHPSETIQCLTPEILILVQQESTLLNEICESNSWRKRLALVKKIRKLNLTQKAAVYTKLHTDKEEEIRILLAKNLDCLEDWVYFATNFLKDENSAVRALAVQMIGTEDKYHKLLEDFINDPSWEVKRELLLVQNTISYTNIAIPLIDSLENTSNWRVRMEVLESIHKIAKTNETLLKEHLTIYLFKYLKDKVFEIRLEASNILKELIQAYDWTKEWYNSFNDIILSNNYLHRISAVNSIIAFDLKYYTSFAEKLLNDPINNVKLYTIENLDPKFLTSTSKEIILELTKSEDEELKKAALNLINKT